MRGDKPADDPAAERPISPSAQLRTTDVPPKRTLLAYGALALPLWLTAMPHLAYLTAFYAQERRLSAGVVGLVFLGARLWDAVANLIIGWLSDRSMSRWGRRKPWVLIGTPFLIISTWCLFVPPHDSGVVHLAVWAVVFYTAWAAMYVPYVSWGTELASEYTQRSRVTSFRETFTMLANLFIVAAPLALLAKAAPLSEVLHLIAVAVLALTPLVVLSLARWVPDPPPSQRVKTQLLKELIEVAQDRAMRCFVLATLCYYVGEGVANAVLVFYFNVGLGLPDKLFWAIFILYVATLVFVPLMLRVARVVEKHRLLAAAVAIQLSVYAAFAVAPQGNFAVIVILEIILGLATSAILSLPTSMLADIIDHGEAGSGERRSGAYVAVFNLALKIGMALGVGVAFGALEWLGFEPSAAQHSASDAIHIRWVGFGLAALLQIPVVFLYLKHPITRAIQQQLQEKIRLRREVDLATS